MKQLQISVPEDSKSDTEEVLENYSSDVSSSKAERDGKSVVEFSVTVNSDQIDELTEELKHLDDVEIGDLSVRVIKQESLIRKGQKTLGSSSMLSQAEIYSQAQEAAEFNRAQWMLIVLSSVIASYGLISDNVIAVIGAMMVAPILSPFISGALSIAVGDQKLFQNSIKTGVFSALIAIVASFIAVIPFEVGLNSTLTLVSTPSIELILLSISVGAAAALSFSTGIKEQMAGVAVAIALIPPLASIGIGLKLQNISLILDASRIAALNLVSIIASGFICFRLIDVKPSTYYKKKQASKMHYVLPIVFSIVFLLVVSLVVSSVSL